MTVTERVHIVGTSGSDGDDGGDDGGGGVAVEVEAAFVASDDEEVEISGCGMGMGRVKSPGVGGHKGQTRPDVVSGGGRSKGGWDI